MKHVSFVTDSHAHCGLQDTSFEQSFDAYFSCTAGSPIQTVVMFAPVMEIYNRYDYHFSDTPDWEERRTRANTYVQSVGNKNLKVIPYFFIWNDFAVSQLTQKHKGIKWHRHSNEPEYQYDSPDCAAAVLEIKKRQMPVVLEEELANTLFFIRELAKGVRVIIPHLGGLNGGYSAIKFSGLWDLPDVFADTALASTDEILDYIDNFGHDRLMFGSDFPFGEPRYELEKIFKLNLPDHITRDIVQNNIHRLLSTSNL